MGKGSNSKNNIAYDPKRGYHRSIGYWVNSAGNRQRKRFWLGRDEQAARLAVVRLRLLWENIIATEQAVRLIEKVVDTNGKPLSIPGPPLRPEEYIPVRSTPPIWEPLTLKIAQAIQAGDNTVGFSADELGTTGPAEYRRVIHSLNETYKGPGITIAPADDASYRAGAIPYSNAAQHFAFRSAQAAEIAGEPTPAEVGGSVHTAIDECIQWIKHQKYVDPHSKTTTEYGTKTAESLQRIRDRALSGDMALSRFGYDEIEKISHYFAARPMTKRGTLMAIDTIRNHMKVLRLFVRWLHRTNLFTWCRPDEVEAAMQINYRTIKTHEEIASKASGPPTLSIDDLAILYRHASAMTRVFMLMAMNFAFKQAEIISLRNDEIDLQTLQLKRIRQKSLVYGQLPIWPETASALKWLRRHRAAKGIAPNAKARDLVFYTKRGGPYTRQLIANAWNNLQSRAQEACPGYQRLSFKHLEKTIGGMIRDIADGETASIYLWHGHTTDDALLDRYTPRNFGRVADALISVIQSDALR